MLLNYALPLDIVDQPAPDQPVEVSGDPDQPVLRGVILRHREQDGMLVLSILLPDGQLGALDLQRWVDDEGDLGLRYVEMAEP